MAEKMFKLGEIEPLRDLKNFIKDLIYNTISRGLTSE